MPHRVGRTLLVLLVSFSAVPPLRGQEPKQMAITFDDLPFGYPRSLTIAEQHEAVARVLATLGKHAVRATMFVVGGNVTEANRGLVEAIAAAGHAIGNHSFSHRDLGRLSAEEYVLDIHRGGEAIAPWLTGVHYFRYPLLRQGDTAAKRDAVLQWLAARGIVVAPVTIDNDDFVYNQRLVDARMQGQALDVRDAYLEHMLKMAAHYDAKGRALTGRGIRQVLLLHLNYLNSLYLDDLLQQLRGNGWSFITLDEALKDGVYKLKYDYAGARGAGHLDAIRPPAN
jgi:peptidoglycan/xylan/chitin deacetylase (PgdA/CDA1 family)